MDSFISSTPQVAYLGAPSLVGIYFVDELLKRGCKVLIFAEDQLTWQSGVLQLNNNFGVSFRTGKNNFSQTFDYIYVSTTLPMVMGAKDSSSQNLEKLLKDATKLLAPNGKIVVALPLLKYSKKNTEEQKTIQKFSEQLQNNNEVQLRVVYVGDVFGRGMDFYDNRPISNILLEFVSNKKFIFPDEFYLVYPIRVEDAAKEIVKTFFSYWRVDESRVVSGVINYGNLFLLLKKFNQDLEYKLQSSEKNYELLTKALVSVNKKVEENIFNETISWIERKIVSEKIPTKTIKFTQKHKKISKKRLKLLATIFTAFIFFVISPFLILIYSWFAKNASAASFAKSMFIKWTGVPFVGQKFVPFVETSALVENFAKISSRSKSIFMLSDIFLQGVQGKQEYDLDDISEKIYLELDSLYNETSFFESDIAKVPLANFLINDSKDFTKLRSYIYSAKELVKVLPDLISGEKPKTYMLLLQNNNHLRPTGGLITRFALWTFEKGKLIKSQVYETKKVDERLKGFVAPPEALEKYAKAANWFMLDSNWDADFTISAQNAEWFLEKELDIKVDGVIGVDEKIATITQKNLDDARILGPILLNLAQERHLQVYSHNSRAQNALAKISFSGETIPPDCGVECPIFWAGLSEASLGESNINPSISRFSRFEVNFQEKRVDYIFSINYKNLSDKQHKSYLRAMSNKSAVFDSVKIVEADRSVFVDPEITGDGTKIEAGVYFELEAGEEKTIVYSWSEPTLVFKSPGSRGLIYLRKQAGTEGDRVEIVVNPSGRTLFTDPAFELTSDGTYRYNTELKRDFSANINN